MQAAMLEGKTPANTTGTLIGRHEANAFSAGAAIGKLGNLEVRLARDEAEIAAAQEVRYRVFYEELGAKKGAPQADRTDADLFDHICDHLVVFDTSLPGPSYRRIVGTYRLLRQESAAAAGGFYSESEFELPDLVARHPDQRFLELGRSCVLPQYRSKRTIEVLWQGIWAYINHYDIGVMTGCASFPGTDPQAHAEALTYLAHHCRTDKDWDVRAVPDRYHSMNLMPIGEVSAKAAIAALPPLIKGYLRVGARIGDGCVIDHDFSTVDVFVVQPVKQIADRYISYYSTEGQGCAA